MNTNYNLIKKILGDFATGHNQLINAYLSFSDQRSYLLEQDKTFPCLYGVINNFNLDQNAYVINWSLRVYFMDIVLDGRENEDSVMNNTGEIALDFIKYLKKYEDDVELLNNSNATPLNNFDNNKFNGWYIDVVLSTKADQCAIPGDFPEVFRPETLCDYIGISSASEIVDCLESDPAKLLAIQNIVCDLPELEEETIFKTGQTTSYRNGDDGMLQLGNGEDFFTLSYINPFGNTLRFTDIIGTQDYDGNGDILLDWSSWIPVVGTKVRGYLVPIQSTLLNLGLASAYDEEVSGFPNWRAANINQMSPIINREVLHGLNYFPFNSGNTQAGSTQIGSVTTNKNSTGTRLSLSGSEIIGVSISGSRRIVRTRLFDLSELGL